MSDPLNPTSDSAVPPGDELQFDRVEPLPGAAEGLACNSCKRPIVEDYWHVNGLPTCTSCQNVLVQHFRGSIPWRIWGRVLAWGGGAAALGTVLYFAVLKISGYELGIIAIAVGLMVGGGVRKAAQSRGGWKLQAVAMALTYASIVSSYMPAVYKGLMESGKQEQTTAPADPTATTATAPAAPAAGAVADPAAPPAVKAADPSPSPASAKKFEPPTSSAQAFGYFLLALGGLFFLACLSPFLAGFQNFMGWIIIGIALYEAWKINRRIPLVVLGPFPQPDGAPSPAASVDEVQT